MVHGCIHINLLFTAKSEKCIERQGPLTILKGKKKFKEFFIRKIVVL
jgi:hypothetical protein